METYEKLVLDVVLFESSDVIITSNTGLPAMPASINDLYDEEM